MEPKVRSLLIFGSILLAAGVIYLLANSLM